MKAQNDSAFGDGKPPDGSPVGLSWLNSINCETRATRRNLVGNTVQLKYQLEKQGNGSAETGIAVRRPGRRDLALVSFFAKPYAKQHVPKRALKAVAVKKKRSNKHAPDSMMPINLDMPGFQRLESVLAIFPVSRAAWYAGIAEGRYPAGIQIGKRSVAWSNASLKALIEDVSNQGGETFDTS
jgi:predicted DNA-binding transcriptional regulator AlpA